jgi:hypothetical protein
VPGGVARLPRGLDDAGVLKRGVAGCREILRNEYNSSRCESDTGRTRELTEKSATVETKPDTVTIV